MFRPMISRNALAFAVSCILVAIAGTKAHATNGKCEEMRLLLGPIYQQLVQRLQWHLYNRDVNLKIDAETDTQAFMKFRQQADFYNKRIVNVIREYNDGDREASHQCSKLIFEADCDAYHVYQDAVANLPGSDRESILAEGKRRCDRAANYGPPPTASPDKYADVKTAHAATLERLVFSTNRQNLFPISDADALVPVEQRALGMNPGQQISWTGPSGKSSGTISVTQAIPVGSNYEPCKEFVVTISTAYSNRRETETFCAVNGRWERR